VEGWSATVGGWGVAVGGWGIIVGDWGVTVGDWGVTVRMVPVFTVVETIVGKTIATDRII